MGAFAFYKQWLEKAYDGVSLGEMVQWSDLIASMYVLGHNITLSAEQDTINRYFSTLSIKTYNDQWAKLELMFWLLQVTSGSRARLKKWPTNGGKTPERRESFERLKLGILPKHWAGYCLTTRAKRNIMKPFDVLATSWSCHFKKRYLVDPLHSKHIMQIGF